MQVHPHSGDGAPLGAPPISPPETAPEIPLENPPRRPPGRKGSSPVGRRVVLGMLGLGAAGVVGGRWASDALSGALSAMGPAQDLLPGSGGWIYYTVTPGYPYQSPDVWRLQVNGLVSQTLTLTVDDLQAMPATYLTKDFQCVTGWRVPNVKWTGVQLSHVLALAGVQPSAIALNLVSYDGVYTESLTLDQAARPDVIVAYSMLGGPIGREHGGPVRLYVAPMYGYKSIKWLSAIQVVDKVDPGYWEQTGMYDINAWIGSSNGRHDTPVD
ncbi:MAG: molybdopterin-dependent oxidoreductase [Acidimicrobiales bacterium]